MDIKYLAHTKDGKNFINEDGCQELKAHLLQTAELAKKKADAFDCGHAGELVGLLHDVGKYSKEFQDKICNISKNPTDHSTAGAYILNGRNEIWDKYLGMIIAAHHTGLLDRGTRVSQDPSTYFGKINNYDDKPLPYKEEINIPQKITHRKITIQSDKLIQGFQLATYIRMLFSVLVDSDFTDTENFCKDINRDEIIKYPSPEELCATLIEKLPSGEGTVNEIRNHVQKNCLSAAEKPQGLFTLTVPTGGGKTLSSLAFALKHAKTHGLRRIIYVIPYTSIIEQNSKVFKDYLGNENVLEHHSGIVVDGDEEDYKVRWASENWDIPVIVTTNVQFFESLFAAKTTKSRKIHNIAKSVIIFDEAQTLPLEYLSPCMAITSELITNYGVSVVLCSATQPLADKYMYKNIKPVEIADNPEDLCERLKRVDFIFAGEKDDDALIEEISNNHSSLVVVNSRKHAFSLYKRVKDLKKEGLFYLSTLLIPDHRSKKLAEIKQRLKENLPVTVISTSMVEAGVDLDFPVVYRSIAGIDSIIQAGGRANREGKLSSGKVIIFKPVGDDGKIPRSLQNAAKLGKEVIDCLGEKAFELEGIKMYFELLYSTKDVDKQKILSEFEMKRDIIVKMNFATVAEKFNLIEDNTCGIVIDCDGSNELIANLRKGEYDYQLIRKLQRYSISVYKWEFENLKNMHALENYHGIDVLITQAYYSEEMGLDIFSGENKNAESFIL